MWQQYFCCTSALHLMQSNNGIHITELICPIKIRLRVNVQCSVYNYVRKSCILFDRGRLHLKNFSLIPSWQDTAPSLLYCDLVSCCDGFCDALIM